jgi:DNA-binding response OmpR family regulator
MNPIRANSSPACHSALHTTRRDRFQLEALHWNELYARIGTTDLFHAYNIAQALKISGDERLDAVLIDLNLNGEDGMALYTQLSEADAPPCVIMLSVTSHPENGPKH